MGEHGLALLDAEKLIVLVPVHEGLGVERDVGEVCPGEFGLIARDRLGDAVCLVVEDEREQVVASLAAAVAALVDEDAELLGQWGLLMEWKKLAGGLPRHLVVAQRAANNLIACAGVEYKRGAGWLLSITSLG